jgi:hypothetical protein
MAKKKMGKFHGIHISPKAGTHYEVRHDPVHEPAEGKEQAAMPTLGGDGENHEKLFAHGEREGLHKHIDALMDAHEGKASSHEEPDEDDMPKIAADHPMHKLKRSM